MERHPAIKRDKLLIHATTQVDLKGIMVLKKSQYKNMYESIYMAVQNDEIMKMANR